MDETIWKIIRVAIRTADRRIPRTGRTPVYRDELIVRMFFWAVWHDRPLSWASRRSSYGRLCRPQRLPSNSQFCKRLKAPRVEAVIARVFELLSGQDEPVPLAYFDGKPLPIGDCAQDRDARTGHGNGRFSHGYKMHALGDCLGRIRAFRVKPMNEAEQPVARQELASYVPEGCVVLADGGYDSKSLYAALAERGAFFFAPLKKNAPPGTVAASTSPARRAAMEVWRDSPELAERVYAMRTHIERIFSALTCAAGGLGPLPAWVRGLGRVTRWVTAKVSLYNARVLVRRLAW